MCGLIARQPQSCGSQDHVKASRPCDSVTGQRSPVGGIAIVGQAEIGNPTGTVIGRVFSRPSSGELFSLTDVLHLPKSVAFRTPRQATRLRVGVQAFLKRFLPGRPSRES